MNKKKKEAAVGTISNLVNDVIRNSIDEDVLRKLVLQELANQAPHKINLKVNDNEPVEVKGYARPELDRVIKLAVNRMNILMVGPAGCGKTHIAKQVSELLNLRFGSISCSGGMSESHLTGWLLPRDNGNFKYTPSVFVDIYENGGVFLLDEIDAADSNTLLFINQALANGSFFAPQRFESPEIVKHPDCVIIAAANTYGTGGSMTYSGRERLDEATLDRFRAGVVEVKYDSKLEEALIDEELLSWGRQIRKRINDTRLQRVMSTRFLLDATKLKSSGASLAEIRDIFFCGWHEDEYSKVA